MQIGDHARVSKATSGSAENSRPNFRLSR